MSARARLKLAVIEAIGQAGGREGAAATCQRHTGTVAHWQALNRQEMPTLDCAFRLDAAAVADGKEPLLLMAHAEELGFTVSPLPDGEDAGGGPVGQLMAATGQMGKIADALMEAQSDGRICPRERDQIVDKVDRMLAYLVDLRQTLGGEGAPGDAQAGVRQA